MIDVKNYSSEIFSMLGNLCIPTINHTIKTLLNRFLDDVEEVLDEKDLGYLVEVLMNFDLDKIEEKHDLLNINFVELTYALYEVWMDYIESEIKTDLEIIYHIDKEFIESTNEKFFVCILNQDLLTVYKELHDCDTLKEKLVNTKIVSKYQDNVIRGKKSTQEINERIIHVFKVVKDYLENLDADLYLYEFIEDYEQYCLMIVDRIKDIDEIMKRCKNKYLTMCFEVFGSRIETIYQELDKRGIEINTIKLKLHILEFLKIMVI